MATFFMKPNWSNEIERGGPDRFRNYLLTHGKSRKIQYKQKLKQEAEE